MHKEWRTPSMLNTLSNHRTPKVWQHKHNRLLSTVERKNRQGRDKVTWATSSASFLIFFRTNIAKPSGRLICTLTHKRKRFVLRFFCTWAHFVAIHGRRVVGEKQKLYDWRCIVRVRMWAGMDVCVCVCVFSLGWRFKKHVLFEGKLLLQTWYQTGSVFFPAHLRFCIFFAHSMSKRTFYLPFEQRLSKTFWCTDDFLNEWKGVCALHTQPRHNQKLVNIRTHTHTQFSKQPLANEIKLKRIFSKSYCLGNHFMCERASERFSSTKSKRAVFSW